MWANNTSVDLFSWLREFNKQRAAAEGEPVKVFGIDLYSLFTSAEEVVRFLDVYDPELCEVATARYNKLYRVAATAARADGDATGMDAPQREVCGRGTRPEPNTYGEMAARLGDAWAVETQDELSGVLAEIQRRVGE